MDKYTTVGKRALTTGAQCAQCVPVVSTCLVTYVTVRVTVEFVLNAFDSGYPRNDVAFVLSFFLSFFLGFWVPSWTDRMVRTSLITYDPRNCPRPLPIYRWRVKTMFVAWHASSKKRSSNNSSGTNRLLDKYSVSGFLDRFVSNYLVFDIPHIGQQYLFFRVE